MIRVDQIIITASPGDAITSMALKLRTALRARWHSDIYARMVLPALRGDVRELHELPVSTNRGVIVYHSSYGEPEVTDVLLRRREPIVLVYHNLTPSEHFMAWSAEFARGVEWGRHELRVLRPHVVKVIADSTYNAGDLARYGFENITVLPAGIDPGRLRALPTDIGLARSLDDAFPHGYAVVIAQQLPHKRVERVIEALHIVRTVHEIDLGLVVVGPSRIHGYTRALERHAQRLHLDRRWFTGAVDDRSLGTILGRAAVLVSASDHEGLALPPIEAMALGVPVIVRGVGAVPETVGTGGLVLPPDAGAMLLAEAIALVVTDDSTRASLIGRGLARVEELASRSIEEELASILGELV